MEIPGFQESAFHTLREPQTKITRRVFDRQAALQHAPDHIKKVFEDLFRQIDIIELTINFYELENGKRTKPPRDALLNRFSEQEADQIRGRAIKLTQYKYLKLRHLLVELRSQQYDYYDLYTDKIVSHGESINNVLSEIPWGLDVNIDVLPLGLRGTDAFSQKLFGKINPKDFTEEELRRVSELLWKPKSALGFDFRNIDHLFSLYELKENFEEDANRDKNGLYSTAALLLKTLEFYEGQARLTAAQKDILSMKLTKKTNSQIASYINKEYNKTYNDNYISTILHQRILPAIADAAIMHAETAKNLFYPENFKVCRDCGEVLLLTPENFVRQKKSRDGFSPRCKRCEKIKRESRKNETNR